MAGAEGTAASVEVWEWWAALVAMAEGMEDSLADVADGYSVFENKINVDLMW